MNRIIALIIVLVLGLSAFFVLKEFKNQESSKPLRNKESFQFWVDYKDPDGLFQVKMPSMPQFGRASKAATKEEKARTYDMYIAKEGDGAAYTITEIFYPEPPIESSVKDLLKKTVDEMIATNASNLLENLSFENKGGRHYIQFSINNDKVSIHAHAFFVGRTLYILSGIYPKGTFKEEAFLFFVDSFQVLKKEKSP